MATKVRLTTLNEHLYRCYESHTTVLGEITDDLTISQAPPIDRYREQMAELVAQIKRDRDAA